VKIVRLFSVLGVSVLLWASSVTGCSHPMQRCETLYEEQRYIEAAEAFERTEQRLANASAEERAEYGLYRGLTFLHLDDLASARTWLAYARAVQKSVPDALATDERTLLDTAWTELDQRSRKTPAVGVAASPVANAESVPVVSQARAPTEGAVP
jgi:hypothetical protein